ncbi:14-3-3 protein [Tritrichomonas foetus]|uniref:14-3-3 protein n=1 Tax=Tritrichomonas foetus TaxID=1144522 RepID=A0A1J4K3T0_9EUKA|nr:14-3-3 protein [Tritrichomonas foetus]|eukprot:OHT06031.1 14-3-3 protein [Tritrichomonas foetus]
MFEADNRVKIYLAHVIYESGKINDAADIIRQLVEAKYVLQPEDRMLVINVWLSIVNPHRSAILNMKDIPKPCDNIHIAIEEMTEILNKNLDEIINIIQTHILSQSMEEEGKALFLRYLADFQRYKLDCVDPAEIAKIGSESRSNYMKAIDFFKTQPNQNVEILMSSYLNYSILLADYLDQKLKALDLITQQHHELSMSLEKYPPDTRAKVQDIVDLMAENIERWKPKQEVDL